MTREEAIRLIGWLKCTTNREDDLEAIDMAIEALKAEPKLIRVEYSPFRIKETSTPSQTSFRGTQEVHYYEVPSVVRCKDCRHGWYDDDIEYYTCRHPKGLNEELYGVDFCSYGERREP